MENNTEIDKVKEKIKIYMGTNIQPMLDIKRTTNIVARSNLIRFNYDVSNQKEVKIFRITFDFTSNGQENYISVNLLHDTITTKINNDLDLERFLSPLKKDVKKYIFSQMYDK
jgi:hypothetical protein